MKHNVSNFLGSTIKVIQRSIGDQSEAAILTAMRGILKEPKLVAVAHPAILAIANDGLDGYWFMFMGIDSRNRFLNHFCSFLVDTVMWEHRG